ncbi:flavin-nucleotide-binding protein [Roseivivax halodurans JCM 10272]|uniref:Flavin-nucleotide-binding protein n=1 Tax=Roseivivax halodurans JCM 10272 TaxID=1449350 RepID=X7EC99_9RHOB|nr:pyridoxamine 5'-phosphate oxidase family protein [Roseivivax halodurans]ETX13562.1 flavin-nucleotide-binding protein [Roseivivax halodurans JCM 10272]
MQPRPEYDIVDETKLRALFPPTHDLAAAKVLGHLDRHARDFISRAPFICIGTQAENRMADVSPRGDPAGFVHVLDDRTLLIPDRPGNNRLDSLANIIANPVVALLFLIPGYDETLRVNGRARITTDPDVLTALAMQGRLPRCAIVLTVEEAFLHCAKALRRSRLWDPEARQDRTAMPSLMTMMLDAKGEAPADPAERAHLDDALEEAYRTSMY